MYVFSATQHKMTNYRLFGGNFITIEIVILTYEFVVPCVQGSAFELFRKPMGLFVSHLKRNFENKCKANVGTF